MGFIVNEAAFRSPLEVPMSDRDAHVPADPDRMANLYEKVVMDHRRVEITLPAGQCVIISKQELDALERALEILADSDAFRDVCASVEHLCDACRDATSA
jgi:PHD/YefM family antitoxin component YafN of YafNO toxin-antitoxin module